MKNLVPILTLLVLLAGCDELTCCKCTWSFDCPGFSGTLANEVEFDEGEYSSCDKACDDRKMSQYVQGPGQPEPISKYCGSDQVNTVSSKECD